jgi:hypothetical protein
MKFSKMSGLLSGFADTFESEKRYAEGDKSSLMFAILFSCANRTPIPQWAQDALVKALLSGPIKSWDDVFGQPTEKGKQATALFERMTLLLPVFASTEVLHAQGRSLEPDLFDEIGQGLEISERAASRIYYAAAPVIQPLLDKVKEGLAKAHGEERVAAALSAALALFSVQKPGEALSDAVQLHEMRGSKTPDKDLEEFVAQRLKELLDRDPDKAADLSDFLKRLTKKP